MSLVRLLAVLLTAALVVAACGDDDTSAGDEPPDNADLAVKPVVEVPEGDPPAELVVEDLIEGDGAEAQAGDLVSVQYVGVSFSSGEQFDASWDRGQPLDFAVGRGAVIAGWDQGVEGMKVGGRRQLVIPPDLAYGEAGSGGGIGPNETLVFVVDLLSVQQPVTVDDVILPESPPGELVVEDLVVGDGAELAEGDTATVHYIGVALSTGEVFDSSWERGQAATFPLAQGQLIEGWVQGLPGMSEGGRRRLVIPPDLAYGDTGTGPIGPDETLVFVVDLVSIG